MEMKFKILVLRLLSAILYRLSFPAIATMKDTKDSKESREFMALSVDVHAYIREADLISRTLAIQLPEGKPLAPITGPKPSENTAKMMNGFKRSVHTYQG